MSNLSTVDLNLKPQNEFAMIVFCYGYLQPLNISSESITESKGLKHYYLKAIRDIAEKKTQGLNIRNVVLSGGYSLPQNNISEAESAFELFKTNLSYLNIICENVSLNHSEHLTFSWLILRKFNISNVIIYVDENFYPKVEMLINDLYSSKVNFEIIPIFREDIHPDNNKETQIKKGKIEKDSVQYQSLMQLMQNQ
jgi:hypothetical protein